MKMTRELFEYLALAAQGDESECPPDIDVIWHQALAYHQAYKDYCLENFGVLIEHVASSPGPCQLLSFCALIIVLFIL
jgi:hypothetical protein